MAKNIWTCPNKTHSSVYLKKKMKPIVESKQSEQLKQLSKQNYK